jgi:hypothetical protein
LLSLLDIKLPNCTNAQEGTDPSEWKEDAFSTCSLPFLLELLKQRRDIAAVLFLHMGQPEKVSFSTSEEHMQVE